MSTLSARAQTSKEYTYTVTSATYDRSFSLNNNESLYIPAGITFKGSVNWNGNGASLTTAGKWLCPGNIPVGQNGVLTIEKTGSISCQDLNLNSTGAIVYNWGQLALTNCQTAAGTTFRNYSRCILKGYINNSGKLYNEGTLPYYFFEA